MTGVQNQIGLTKKKKNKSPMTKQKTHPHTTQDLLNHNIYKVISFMLFNTFISFMLFNSFKYLKYNFANINGIFSNILILTFDSSAQ